MPLKKRPLSRDGGAVRDASLIIVASEDTYAAEQYFRRFKARRSQFVPLPTLDNRSAPQHVMERLAEYAATTATEEHDTFWLCVDRDRWPQDVLENVFRECIARGYQVVLSSPCFELWMLLHFEDVAAAPLLHCRDVKTRLGLRLNPPHGGYATHCCRSARITAEMVESAINRAKVLYNGSDFVPDSNMSQVYRILEELRTRDRIEIE